MKPVCVCTYIQTYSKTLHYNSLLHPIFLSKHQHILHMKLMVTVFAQEGGNMGIGSLQPQDFIRLPGDWTLRRTGRDTYCPCRPWINPQLKKARFMGLEEKKLKGQSSL